MPPYLSRPAICPAAAILSQLGPLQNVPSHFPGIIVNSPSIQRRNQEV